MMKKLRIFLSIAACKFTRWALRITGRGGTSLPGKVALKLCPDILGVMAKNVKTVVITGTNGKTTSSRIVEQVLADAGVNYFANRSGANLIQGITAEYAAHSTLTGNPKCEYAVIECDEAATKRVCKFLDPKVMVVTNIFRDQLDRFGEVFTTLENVKIGVKNSPNAIVCLNADCSMTVSIAEEIDNEVIFFGVNTEIYKDRVEELSDASHCIHCTEEYEYDYITYGHLGGFRCPKCGFHRPAPQVAVTKILRQELDSSTVEMDIHGTTVNVDINIAGGYNIYNAVAAVTAAQAFGFDLQTTIGAVSAFRCGFGRMETFDLDGHSVRMILVKNPAGCNQVLNFLSNIDEETLFVCILNDNDCDGTDVSWIWDVNFETLCGPGGKLNQVLCSGIRADDMAMRFKYAGLAIDGIEVVKDYNTLLQTLLAQDKPVVIMPTYSGMMDFRAKISESFAIPEFWE
ncbi:MAG: MurT ligase domain-containing protein [Oscillospiraceae bacterium]|jgi:UDP-N-acetylmuramyl tripeptide synthase